jgi:hypothetical protein
MTSSETSPARPGPEQEARWAFDFVARIVEAAPRRMATSEDERRAHELIRAEMEGLGLATEVHRFRWNRSLYANLALHFGLGAIGSLAALRSPGLGLALHAASAISFAADSSRAAFLLRRLFPFGDSQNVLGVRPARNGREPRLRIVLLAHADAAFTGVLFQPEFVARFGAKPGARSSSRCGSRRWPWPGLAAVDGAQLVFGKARGALGGAGRADGSAAPRRGLEPGYRGEKPDRPRRGGRPVRGGGLLLLARRLEGRVPDDVEVVFVATGCEESGLGGAQALARDMRSRWDPATTVVLGLDSLANGDLCYYTEGEVFPVPLAPWLQGTLDAVAAAHEEHRERRLLRDPGGRHRCHPVRDGGLPRGDDRPCRSEDRDPAALPCSDRHPREHGSGPDPGGRGLHGARDDGADRARAGLRRPGGAGAGF